MIRFSVNGRSVEIAESDKRALLDILRNDLGFTGVKNGCGQGHCGACTVIVNGKATRSCLVRAGALAGARVETIEGLAQDGRLHPIQQAFLDAGAVQCGFCTPGMIMATKALLDRNLSPSDNEIVEALSNNLCRCTGYAKIIEAVRLAAAMLRGERAPAAGPAAGIGVSVPRLEGRDKVTGALQYGADLTRPGMLWGKALWSAYPHARIRSIDTTAAQRLPGVAGVFTARDLPGVNRFGIIKHDQPALADDKVRFIGDAVAVAFAETEAQAAAAVAAIQVDYEPLEGVFSPQRALEPDAPRVHEAGNLLHHKVLERGDVARGFAEADVIIEGHYTTPFIEHAFLEPEAGLAEMQGDQIVLYIGTQIPFGDRALLAQVLGLPAERIRIVTLPMGGAFGAKEDLVLHVFLCLGAWRLGRPVKMVLTRQESLRVHPKRHAYWMHYKTGARRDGTLTAVEATLVSDTGAYASLGGDVMEQSVVFACGPYYVPNVRVEGKAVYTNNITAGAMRGFGVPQTCFAMEQQMDQMARALGMDPFEFRLRNALREGMETTTGQRLDASVGIVATLERARESLKSIELPASSGPIKIGVGVASGYKNVGLGLGNDDSAAAAIDLTPAGRILARVGCSNVGQGSTTVMQQIAADTLGVPLSLVDVIANDTALTPDGGVTSASRQTYLSGRALHEAAKALRAALLEFAAGQGGCGIAEIQGADAGRMAGAPLTLADVAARMAAEGRQMSFAYRLQPPATFPILSPAQQSEHGVRGQQYRNYLAFAFSTHVAVVAVNTETGEVRVLHEIAAHDLGRTLHPQNVEGQIEGATVMGMGYALSEEFVVEAGWNKTDTLRKCGVPKITDAPHIIPILVEDPDPQGPYGAKGVAEAATLAPAAAIANAIYDAIGARIYDLPAKPERVLQALRARRERQEDEHARHH
jgi:selenium-dependent xanthine dehydrogenase